MYFTCLFFALSNFETALRNVSISPSLDDLPGRLTHRWIQWNLVFCLVAKKKKLITRWRKDNFAQCEKIFAYYGNFRIAYFHDVMLNFES